MTVHINNGNGASRRGRRVTARCAGCGGEVVRHSLGCGMAVGRCTRCFARYELAAERDAPRGRWSAFLHDMISWREED